MNSSDKQKFHVFVQHAFLIIIIFLSNVILSISLIFANILKYLIHLYITIGQQQLKNDGCKC